ncbi:acyl-CoA dehydrogenase family protein [Micromonospora sp. M12]
MAAGVRARRASPLRRALPGDLRRRPGPRRAGGDRAVRAAQPGCRPRRAHLRRAAGAADPQVRAALDSFAETGLLTAGLDATVGGLQLPHAVAAACFTWFQAANVATSAYPFLTLGNANLLLAHGTTEQVDTYVRPMLEGRFFGTMCLSEPHAGSSLADITTRAEPQADGSYRLFGTKMWISGGDHELAENIVHLVLARIPGGPPGSRASRCSSCPRCSSARTGRSVTATTWCWPGSTTRWASAAPPTPCSTSATAGTRRWAGPARSATWSARRTRVWRRCST